MSKYRQQETNIFFIDDNETDNFIHQQLFHRYCKNYRYTFFKSAGHALDFLKIILTNRSVFSDEIPEFIFLNLRLPEMSGFEFLDEAEQLNKRIDYKVKVVIITVSVNPIDVAKCALYKSVSRLIMKPITINSLSSLGLKLKSKEELIMYDHMFKKQIKSDGKNHKTT